MDLSSSLLLNCFWFVCSSSHCGMWSNWWLHQAMQSGRSAAEDCITGTLRLLSPTICCTTFWSKLIKFILKMTTYIINELKIKVSIIFVVILNVKQCIFHMTWFSQYFKIYFDQHSLSIFNLCSIFNRVACEID